MILQQPFPSYCEFNRSTLRLTFLSGFVVFLVLALFKPFGIGKAANYSLLYPLSYGILTTAVVTLNLLLLPGLFPRTFKENNWTVGKELALMLWHIISVSLGNVTLTHFLYNEPFSVEAVLRFLGISAAVGIFPVTLMILLKQQALLNRYSAGAAALESGLQQPATEEKAEIKVESTKLVLTGDNQSERLELFAEDLRYINSADNYIRVYFKTGGGIEQKVLRSTLKKAGATLAGHAQLFRCHRAYIVNLAAVAHVTGNAQGYKLHIDGVEEPIPVSRNLNAELGNHLQQYKTGSR